MTPIAAKTPSSEELLIANDLFRRFVRAAEWAGLRADLLRVDVEESDRSYRVRAEIPGARKDDVSVDIDAGLVSIHVKPQPRPKDAGERDGRRWLLHELRHDAERSRTVRLAHAVDEKKASARFVDGVLSLTVPKRTTARRSVLRVA